jgi:uncharacterized delta-60 repeat protein
VIVSPGSAHAVPGDPDPTFGDGGWAVTDIPGYLGTDDALIQPDGRIFVIASASGNEMAAWRFQPDGDPDPSFGGDGLATIGFERPSAARAAALQPDGKLVLVGYAGRRLAVARLMPNGEPDAGFGVAGSTRIPLEERATGEDVAIASDGSIVVGVSLVEGRPPYRYGIGTRLLRLTPQGTLDATFGSQGVVSFGERLFGDLALDDQDSIVVALPGPPWLLNLPAFFVARLDADGAADPTFGGDGVRRYRVRHVWAPNQVVIDPEGRILLAVGGATRYCLFRGAVVRLTSDGALDATFSDDGVALRTCMLVSRLAVADDGRILVGGAVGGAGAGEQTPTLSRLEQTGQKDISFGDAGTVVTSPPGWEHLSTTRGLLIQGDGKVVLIAGGFSTVTDGFAVGRFMAT